MSQPAASAPSFHQPPPIDPAATPLCELRQVSHAYGGESEEILHEVSIAVRENDAVALLGPSGCGKSTILRVLAGLIRPKHGEVRVKDKPLQGINPGVALVFQNFALFPWLTVSQNILLGLHKLQLPEQEQFDRLNTVIDLVGLQGYAHSLPKELSGGMKQRVGFARAIIAQPEILCLDDPFSALDILTAETLRSELLRLWTDPALSLNSLILVTNKIEETVLVARHIVVLAAHPCRVQTVVKNELPYPRDPNSPAFQQLVAQLHGILTLSILPDGPETTFSVGVIPASNPSDRGHAHIIAPLPRALLSEVQGLVSILGDEAEDLYDLSCLINKDFAATLNVVKAAEVLGLVDTPGQDVVLTPVGKRFRGLGIGGKKSVLREQMLKIKMIELVLRLIDASPEKVLHEDRLIAELGRIFPHEKPKMLWKTILNWCRYAEVLNYDTHKREITRFERVVFAPDAPEGAPVAPAAPAEGGAAAPGPEAPKAE